MKETEYHSTEPETISPEIKDDSIDAFIGQRSRILNSKLDILMDEIKARLAIRDYNFQRVHDDMQKVQETMSQLSPRAYYFADTTEKDAFEKLRKTSFDLQKEKRDQGVTCWQDVTRVMQEFINTWEAQQQTAARARLMQSGGLEKIVDDAYDPEAIADD